MFKKVMVVIDPESKDQIALDKALQLARYDDFELILLSCSHTQYLVDGYYFEALDLKKLRDEYVAEQRVLLEEIADPLRANGLNVTTSAIWSYPNHVGVVDQAQAMEVDLIVYHVERHGVFSRVLLTHDDWQLIKLAPAPILLAKDTPWKSGPTILSAVDPKHARHKPSGLDHKILDVSSELANLLDGDHFAIHAYHPVPFSGEYPLDSKTIHKEAFDALMADYDLPEEHCLLVEDATVFALQDAERQVDADIVALGSVSRSIVADLFIGSTTEQVVDYLDCDILALKPDPCRISGWQPGK